MGDGGTTRIKDDKFKEICKELIEATKMSDSESKIDSVTHEVTNTPKKRVFWK